MKPIALVLIPLVATAALATAAIAGERDRGPGLPGQRQGNTLVYAARGFDAVTLAGSARMIVRTGPQFAVSAEGPAEAFANFRVVQEGRTLKVGQRYEGRRWIPADGKLIVRVTLPALTAASVGGSGSIDVDRVGGDRFAGSVGGSGDLRIARLDARDADLSIGGSGGIVAAGSVRVLDAKVGGSGSIDAAALRAERASVAIGGSGSVRAAVAGAADVSVAGSGSVDLGPQARCRISKVGSGRVRCGG